jgi:hypothetical protein
MSLMDFVVSPPGCGRSVTDFWGWDPHKAQLRCPDEALNISYTELPRPWSPWESSPSRKNPHGRTANQTRDLMIRCQKIWPLDHEAGHNPTLLFPEITLLKLWHVSVLGRFGAGTWGLIIIGPCVLGRCTFVTKRGCIGLSATYVMPLCVASCHLGSKVGKSIVNRGSSKVWRDPGEWQS